MFDQFLPFLSLVQTFGLDLFTHLIATNQPFVTNTYQALAAAFAALLFYRQRGGLIPTGSTQLARVFWAIAVLGLTFAYAAAPMWAVYLTFATGFLSLLNGHGDHHDLGRGVQGQSTDKTLGELLTYPFNFIARHVNGWVFWKREAFDTLMMTWIGFWRGVLVTLPIIAFDPTFALTYIAGSSAMGIAYYIGWRVPFGWKGFEARSTEWGETLTGLFIGLAFLFL